MSDKQAVTVKILDREYRIACEPGERRQLLDAADHLDREMRTIRSGSVGVGLEKVAVLAALNATHELLLLREKEKSFGAAIGERLHQLRLRLDDSLAAHDE